MGSVIAFFFRKVMNRQDFFILWAMRILQICPYDLSRPGGVKSHIFGLSEACTKAGHEVVILGPASEVITSHGESQCMGESLHASEINGIKVVTFDCSRKFNLWGTQIDFSWLSVDDLGKVRTWARTWKPDVVHYHTPWTPFLCAQIYLELSLISNAEGVEMRHVATYHDSPPNSFWGNFLGNWVMPFAARLIIPAFDRTISVSAPQKRYIGRFAGGRRIDVIPNGIAINETYQNTPDTRTPMLLFLGRLEPRKGVMNMLRVFSLVRQSHPNVELVIAGDGPMMPSVLEHVDEEGLSGVTILGMVSEKQKAMLLQQAAVLVCPALYGESFGIILLEGMSAGVPVAGFGNPGYLSVVDGICDENFPAPGDDIQLAERISELLGNIDYRSQVIAKGWDHSRKYDWNKISQDVLRLYLSG